MNLKITTGKVVVADPCYLGDGGMGESIDVANGVYDISVTKVKVEGLGSGTYNKEIVAVAKGKSPKGLKWEKSGGIVVDSGTAGFFDSNVCNGMDEDDIDYWYDDEIVGLDGLTSLFEGRGCAVETALGDGGYDVFVAKEGGKIIGFKIVFLSETDIKYYNTPTLWSREGLVVYHSSNLSTPLYAVPKNKMNSVALIGVSKNGVFGVVDFDANEHKGANPNVTTKIAQFRTPKDGKIAKLFKLSEDKSDVSLPVGDFIFTDVEKLAKTSNDVSKLIATDGINRTSLSYIKFNAPAGVYSFAVDYMKSNDERVFDFAKVVAVRVSKTN